jgi:malate dehydrogenase (oxaloacetate-decarboxylating)(NADP+)
VTSGAGGGALACLDLLDMLGFRWKTSGVTDIKGVVYEGRTEERMTIKARYAKVHGRPHPGRVIEGADVFLGLSARGVLKPEIGGENGGSALIMALANPTPKFPRMR